MVPLTCPHSDDGRVGPLCWHKAQFATFLAVLGAFHLSEFLLASLYMRDELSWTSWLVSKPYVIAMGTAVLEFWLEVYFCPQLKHNMWIAALGLGMVLLGEALRKTAMVTAQHNFTHIIKVKKREEHTLVTHGVYRYMRHPGYAGWLAWSVGTQLILINPLCSMAFAIVAWNFMKDRIIYEERMLRKIFGYQYDGYAAKTPSGLPWIP